MAAAVESGWVYKLTVIPVGQIPTGVGVGTHEGAGVMRIETADGRPQKYATTSPKVIISDIKNSGEPYVEEGDVYYIPPENSVIDTIGHYYEDGEEEVKSRGGSRRRRRRPSRKYKKSKRVLRRKSRATRRR